MRLTKLLPRCLTCDAAYAASGFTMAGAAFALALACLMAVLGGDVLHGLFFGAPIDH
jgi:hypothetical protein